MRRAILAVTVLIGVATMGGCAMGQPSYSQVRKETEAALEGIIDLIPEPRAVDFGAEQEPYSCSDPLLGTQRKGWFYTGHWTVEVPEEFDVSSFVKRLPAALGSGWTEEDLGIDVSFAAVDLVQESTGVSVAVEDHSADGRRVIDVLGISRCGILGEEDRTPSPTSTESPTQVRNPR